jgi:CRP-like cAMP-binding protein
MRSNNLGDSGCDTRFTFSVGEATPPTRRTRFEPRNRLLTVLPREHLLSIWRHLKIVPLVRGKVLFEADEPLTSVYFVETGVVSLVAVFKDGTTAGMATVGREGLIGIGALLGGGHALGRHVVPASGFALALEASRFQTALRESSEFYSACQAYARAFLRTALWTGACNSVHTVGRRCARGLLLSHDRSGGDTVSLTQEYMAEMLGVCRSTVTVAARALQRAGLIRYSRGTISILDRPGLEAASCECYELIRYRDEREPAGVAGFASGRTECAAAR